MPECALHLVDDDKVENGGVSEGGPEAVEALDLDNDPGEFSAGVHGFLWGDVAVGHEVVVLELARELEGEGLSEGDGKHGRSRLHLDDDGV